MSTSHPPPPPNPSVGSSSTSPPSSSQPPPPLHQHQQGQQQQPQVHQQYPHPPETASSIESDGPFSHQPFASSSSSAESPFYSYDPARQYGLGSQTQYPQQDGLGAQTHQYDDDPSSSALRPGTSAGRPTTSGGLRPGTANPFRQQAFQDVYGFSDGTSSAQVPTAGYSARPPTAGGYGGENSGMDWDPYNSSGAAGGGRPRTSRSRAGAGASRAGVGVGGVHQGHPGHQGVGHPGHQGVGVGGQYIDEEDEYYIEEEEEEESEDEGLFAFLPPSTAEQEAERRAEAEAEAANGRGLALAQGQVYGQGQGGAQGQGQGQGEGQRGSAERIRHPPETPDFAFSAAPPPAVPAPVQAGGGGAGAFAYEPEVQVHAHSSASASTSAVDAPLNPPPASRYDPPVSPPSTESNSNDGSRAGGRQGEFRMMRLDGAGRRRSGDEGRRSGEAGSTKESVGAKEGEGKEKTEDKDLEGNAKKAEEGEGEEGEDDEDERDPPHYQNFHPNPQRSNANAGPYKRHREYHYNQAYPQYAVASGVESRGGTGGTTGSAGGVSGIGTGPGRLRGPHGYGGDYEDRERWERKRRSRQVMGKRGGTAGTAETESATANGGSEAYRGGSEYTNSRLGTGESAYAHGNGYGRRGRVGTAGTGGISEVDGVGGYESAGSVRKGSWGYEGSGEWEEGEYEGESREGSIKMEFDFDAIEDEDSPYPEVRASVSNIDDPDMPAMTVRMWVVGLLLCMTSSAFNVFFNFRQPAPSIVPLVLLLLSYPVGKFMAFTLPITTYRIPLPCIPSRWIPSRLPRTVMRAVRPMTFPHAIEFSLNPGPWNIKEHVLVYIMANVAVGNPYALNAIVVLEVYYEFKTGYWFSLVLVLATQLTGFGLAGMCRRFLVWPASMVWPQNLVACTLLNTLHAEDEDDGIGMLGGPHLDPSSAGGESGLVPRKRGMSRYKFFVWTTVGSFFFFFLPGYLFEALSIFSFICWAAPNNVKVNQLFGVKTGLGMSVLTFDWTQISWIGSPLMVPWWAEVHIFAGFVLFYWIMTPILYYTNAWKLAYFPISANQPFDRSGNPYNIAKVLKPDGTFDSEAYDRYSPLFLPATYAVTYLLAFCLSTCVIVHTVLYHGQTLLNGFKKMRVENDDIHAKLMRNYPEVPDWWYASAFCAFFALAIVAVEVWDTGVPVWALLLSVLLPVIYILPSGFIYAMTGQGINLNILAQIIPGSLLAGQPLANMVFKAYSVQTLAEATSFVQDLKLGHYVKVPPRATFLVQLVATTLAAFIQVGVKQWIFDNVEDICSEGQKSNLTCPHNQVFYTASAVWGLIGPTRQFGEGSIYHYHLYAIVIGVFLPIPFWLWRRRYPNSWVKWVSTPVVLNGVSWIPPATGINYSSWFAVGVVFQYVVRKRNFAWWSKFNYVLSSALDSGTVIAVIVIFFTLQFPKFTKGSDDYGVELNWWGNLVHRHTADWQAKPLLPIPEGGIPIPNRS